VLGSYNLFRGVLEVRYATATQKLWVINELPIEQYLRGLAETGSTAGSEFVKTLITAARTYALYKVFESTRHENESYQINSTTDQVYKGYAYELKTPNITAGVTDTRGIVVTHASMISEENKIGAIVAAYSSCTDGRTRSYEERWGGPSDQYPYLVSVPDPNGICTTPPYPASYFQGKSGNHMVGMSAYGALNTINKEGLTYDAILRYYYTGVILIRAYL
jgi:peptidoglycan hydrolase-like amidase